jgi:hypothetical protein
LGAVVYSNPNVFDNTAKVWDAHGKAQSEYLACKDQKAGFLLFIRKSNRWFPFGKATLEEVERIAEAS